MPWRDVGRWKYLMQKCSGWVNQEVVILDADAEADADADGIGWGWMVVPLPGWVKRM